MRHYCGARMPLAQGLACVLGLASACFSCLSDFLNFLISTHCCARSL